MRQRIPERSANHRVVQCDRHIGRVVDLPDLVMLAQRLIAQDFVGEFHPGFRAAGQSVQHDDDPPVRIVGLHQVDVRAVDATLAPEQAAQRLAVEIGTGQPYAIAGREIGRQRHTLAAQHNGRFHIGVMHRQTGCTSMQHAVQVVSVGMQQNRHGRRGHLAPGQRLLIMFCRWATTPSWGGAQGLVRNDRHKLGAKAVAPVEATQSTERQGRGWQEFGWHRRTAR